MIDQPFVVYEGGRPLPGTRLIARSLAAHPRRPREAASIHMELSSLSTGAVSSIGLVVRTLIVVSVGLLVTACVSSRTISATVSAPLAPLPAALDTTWYVSARGRDQGRDTRRLVDPDSLEYGLVVYHRRPMDDAFTSAIQLRLVDSVQLTRLDFEASLAARRDVTADTSGVTVLYVHGFGTSLHEGWQYAAEARVRSHHPARWVVFCWPANGLGLSWPRSRALFSTAYHDDTELASASRRALARAMQSVLAAIHPSQVILASHSLGARVVGAALTNDFPLQAVLVRHPLRAMAFFTPDVESSWFSDSILPAARGIARRVLLYTSGRDRVLAMARQINNSERAGLRSTDPMVRPGLETVDVTDGVVAEGWLTARVGTHHAIRRASAALFDLTHVVGGGFTADCRRVIGTARVAASGVWQLTTQRPPLAIGEGVCRKDESLPQ